ncbi:FAD-dependent oxidoreductase [Bacillus alveayuensis]|uniref:FAD-dependent oxidoreductase n=1 Tax=Aeribacillus alveayuensis TaxID=279215 RepID=UPI0005D1065C|nr:FAD-dependent oxidoreductase [Bacillus alveayuensis]
MPEFKVPKELEPIWREDVTLPSFPKLSTDLHVDVAIVGAGITGITTACLLKKEGFQVAIIDASTILNGITGHTTAKVTTQHGLIYHELIQHFGEEKAKIYFNANQEGSKWIKSVIKRENIECNWTEEDAYIYTNTLSSVQKLQNEMKAYEKLIINGEYVSEIPLNVPHIGAIVMKNQAHFHPLKYLEKLVEKLMDQDTQIYENTVAVDIEEGQKVKVKTRDGNTITSNYLVIASHFPFYWKGLYFARMYAERAYIVAAKTKREYPGGMYITAEEPTRSLRSVHFNGEKVVLFIGENHKTGQGVPTHQHYENLESFANETYGIKTYLYRWSAQDLITTDKLPYIGPVTSERENIFIATGYRKWGMTNGTAAAHLIKDLILQRPNPYKEVVTPARFHTDPDFKKFISTNIDVATHLLKGKLEIPNKTIDDVQKGEGAVIQFEGERKGAYKDEEGKIHVVDTTCTHLKCELEWNSGDRTWDCPCHGSRFSCKGDVIEGPAERPLSYKSIKQ